MGSRPVPSTSAAGSLPVPSRSPSLRGPALLLLVLLLGGSPGPVPAAPPVHRIFLDPGHGGKPENQGKSGGGHFDPLTGRFLNVYRYGTEVRRASGTISEQAQVLALAKLVRERLEWTRSDAGWTRFAALLARYGGLPPPYPRHAFEVRLARENDYLTHPEAGKKGINRHFRIFDSPSALPWKPGQPMTPGRASAASQFAAELVVSLHIDGSLDPDLRGMSALFVPSPRDFELGRQLALGKVSSRAIHPKVRRWWQNRGSARTKTQWLLNDVWTYFTGFGSLPGGKAIDEKGWIGQRWNHLAWAYAERPEPEPRKSLDGPFTGPFWERERSRFELQRRHGGPEEVGGDNLYAGLELLRFIRYGLWKDYAAGGASFGKSLKPEELLPIEHPVCTDWAVPLFTNAVSPYLELGQLLNAKDRFLLTDKLPIVADGLAVGIYSLFAGLPVAAVDGMECPRGLPVPWERYKLPDGRTWFEAARRDPVLAAGPAQPAEAGAP